MKSGIISLALTFRLAFCAFSAFGQDNEGVAAPIVSFDWGPNSQDIVMDVYARLHQATGFNEPIDFFYDSEYFEQNSLAAFVQLQKGPAYHAMVIQRNALDICRNKNELAYIIAHELSHIVLRHLEKIEIMKEKLCRSLAKKKGWPPPETNPKTLEHCFSYPVFQNAVRFYLESLEDQADIEGANLMTIAGFDAARSRKVFRHVADFFWATSYGIESPRAAMSADDYGHFTLHEREARLDRYVEYLCARH